MRRRRFLQGTLAGLGTIAAIGVTRRAEASFHVAVGDVGTDDFAPDGDSFLRLPTLHTIGRRNPDGGLDWEAGGLGDQPGQLNYPKGMMDDPLGERLYVTDTGNHHVDVYSTGGRFLFQFGARGSGAGQFLFPNDVVVDRAGIVYVADTGNHRVQVFDANGGYLRQFGGFGQGGDRLNGPSALALHPDGTLHVADKGNNRIQVFSLHGVYHGRYGGSGDALGQFRQLQAVAADSHGRVYAADRASWLVTMFGPQGQPFLRFQPRFADGTAAVPMGLAITDDDTLFVAAVRGPAGYRAVREFETALYIPTAAQAGRSSKE